MNGLLGGLSTATAAVGSMTRSPAASERIIRTNSSSGPSLPMNPRAPADTAASSTAGLHR
ncbi:hypothetical protein [Micromonospora echinospora]|uniref:hypothetical protein n=1 Tax=Micromonospora echinospora TaxID=1877 RepID=UPI003A839194